MTHQSHYPALIGLIDIGLAGLLLLIVPPLGVLMAIAGVLVVGTCLFRQLEHSPPAPQSGAVRDV
ncbi:hypothetical protein D3D02_11720 [Halobellus sp. Atlit-38R]|nr:hypothetical protein D3D02_11720 [Halobellus sp. Atlit-38R]